MDDRRTFLLEMYREMFADINRHITVVWQSVGVVIGAFALFSLSEKQIMPLDIAISLIVMLCGWLYAHMLDAGYWYNRNLVIIANIERQFLLGSDQKDIQFYFGKHRSGGNKMISHLRIQASLGIGVGILVILFHFFDRVLPGMSAEVSHFDVQRTLPYVVSLAVLIFGYRFGKDRDDAYQSFLSNSPGITVDNQGIVYGPGHTVDP
jgi:hypothetical protein